jgi:hypothetical protein
LLFKRLGWRSLNGVVAADDEEKEEEVAFPAAAGGGVSYKRLAILSSAWHGQQHCPALTPLSSMNAASWISSWHVGPIIAFSTLRL